MRIELPFGNRTAKAKLGYSLAEGTKNTSEQSYESEKRKPENGVSTVCLVLQRQQNLVTARGNERQARTDPNKAIAAFRKSIGSTFQSHNVEVKETSQNVKSLKISTPADVPGSDRKRSAGFSPDESRPGRFRATPSAGIIRVCRLPVFASKANLP